MAISTLLVLSTRFLLEATETEKLTRPATLYQAVSVMAAIQQVPWIIPGS